jgi:CTP:molybdopterin cytidylyltransferase MocA/xanthine/CO dehydrogenase XdhC/CoxF family maturation factor
MQRALLDQLVAARRDGRALVRALDPATTEELLIDPASDRSALGLAAARALGRDQGGTVTVEGRDWFLTVYNVPWEIVIVGAVHIGQALAQLALACGYRVRIIDPRPAYAAAGRFAGVRLIADWPDAALAAEPLTARSALVVLAHDTKIDDPALAAGLRSPAGYIGALGSKRTHAKRLARLAAEGFAEKSLARIHGPVGLAIGARTPGEIAIAILAELVQVRRTPKAAPRVGGVILAAGLSRRMGYNKLVATVSGKPLLRHAVEAALASRLDPVIVVTGHDAPASQGALAGLNVEFVHNPDFAKGLSTSLRQGVKALPSDCDGAMILLGDMPQITPALIDRTIAAFDPKVGRSICVVTGQGTRGHPVLWGRQFFSEIETLDGDAGARSLLDRHPGLACEIEAGSTAPLTDVDTPEALEAYRDSQKGT